MTYGLLFVAPMSMEKFNVKSLQLTFMGVNIAYVICILCLRKIPKEGTPSIGPGPTSEQLPLNLQCNPTHSTVTFVAWILLLKFTGVQRFSGFYILKMRNLQQ